MSSFRLDRRELIAAAAIAATSNLGRARTPVDSSSAPAAQWPTWRGPTRDGYTRPDTWPTNFSDLEKLWSVDLADSYSGPIVNGGLVYTTETVDKRDETLIALDSESGQQVWKQQWPGAMSVPFFAASNGSWIRSTPATNGNKIVVGGMRDVVACFDATSGDELWRVDYAKEENVTLPSFGLVCSPIIDGQSVYVQAGGSVRKLDLSSGRTEWSALKDRGGMSGGAFSSPIISELHGKRQLVVQTRSTLAGVDLQSGAVLWQKDIASFRGMNILTPTVWNNQVFTSCYGGRAQLLAPDPENNWAPNTVWESKTEAYMSSPVVVGDHLYIHLKNSRAACVDLQTGEETWRTTPFGKYWSMVTNGTQILALDQKGELILLNANPAEFSLLDRKTISSEPSWAHIAIAGNRLYVRRQKGLDAYRWG